MGVALVKPITVLLPTFNGVRWLPELLDSLRGQTDTAFSVLIQDDGSTDGTQELLAGLAGEPLFVFGDEGGAHLGAKGSFLSLMRQAGTPLAALCDQDDVWLPERLSRGRRAMEEAETRFGEDTPILVHSDAFVTDACGQTLHRSLFRHQGWDAEAVDLPRLLVQNNVTGCTVLMNAALCQLAAEHADPQRIFMHDWFLAQTAAAFGTIVVIREPLVRYRQHGDNAVGASRTGMAGRAIGALRDRSKSRARVSLTWEQARVFREAYGDLLPEKARDCVDGYLSIETLPHLQRLRALRRGGYLMQSRAARVGQMLFS
mgnify:CR=1 FL=1